MALVFWSSTGLKLRPELVLLMGEGIDPLSVLRVDRPCTSNIQDPLNTVIDGQNPGDIVLRFWISWMNYVELTTFFTTPCGAESCPSNVWQPNTFWHWAEEFRSCVKKTLIQRDFRLDLSTSHYLFVFLCGYIPETLHFAVFMCFVFFADHWLCWGVGGHRTVGIYTEARVPPRGSGGALPSNTRGIHTISWAEGRNHVPVWMLETPDSTALPSHGHQAWIMLLMLLWWNDFIGWTWVGYARCNWWLSLGPWLNDEDKQ